MARALQLAFRMLRSHVWVLVLAIGCASDFHGDTETSGGTTGGDGSGSGSGGGGQGGGIGAGQLTAGEFDDNLNPEVMEQELATLFADEILKGGLPISERVVATVRDGDGFPLPGATVDIADGNG